MEERRKEYRYDDIEERRLQVRYGPTRNLVVQPLELWCWNEMG
jgi:hypothetical protein